MVLSNVVFNYILIFGKFGFPALGIAGAAIGSSLAELVSLIFFILYTRYRIDCRKFGLDRIPKFRPEILKRMLNISFWTMIQNVFSLSTWFLFFLYVEHLGERSLAITNIVRSISGILFMVMMALPQPVVPWSAISSVQETKTAWQALSGSIYALHTCSHCR